MKTLREVVTCCVIMHNMIVETERPNVLNDHRWEFYGDLVQPEPGAGTWEEFLHMKVEVSYNHISKRQQTDLIDHIWALAGHEENEE
jgi:hypothetical protein